ncbi:sporulation integral membrane protein YtvI [Bacillaceae bacterium W0354]
MAINYINLIKLVTLSILIGLICYFSFIYLFPFLIAFALAIIINPIVNILNRKLHLNRKLAVFTVLLIILISFITIITFSIIEFIHLLQYLTKHLPSFLEDFFIIIEQFFMENLERFYQLSTSFFSSVNPDSQLMIKSMFTEMTESLKQVSKESIINFLQETISWLSNVLKSSYYLVFILIGVFFISSDGPKWLSNILNKLPDSYKNYYVQTKKEFSSLVKKYLFAQLLIIFITGSIVFIVLNIFKLSHTLGIALVVMMFDLIPIIGISAVFVPWVLYLFFTSQFVLTIKICLLFLLLIIVRNILEPKLIGSSIGVHPLGLLIILFVFIKLFGFLGFILGPIAAVSLSVLIKVGTLRMIKNYILN